MRKSTYLNLKEKFHLQWKIGKKWHDRRKIITPAFHFQMLEKFTETFDRLSDTFVRKLGEYDAGAEIELFHLVGLFTLDVVCGMWHLNDAIFIFHCGPPSSAYFISTTGFYFDFSYAMKLLLETAMGVSIDALSKPDSDYIKAVKE